MARCTEILCFLRKKPRGKGCLSHCSNLRIIWASTTRTLAKKHIQYNWLLHITINYNLYAFWIQNSNHLGLTILECVRFKLSNLLPWNERMERAIPPTMTWASEPIPWTLRWSTILQMLSARARPQEKGKGTKILSCVQGYTVIP